MSNNALLRMYDLEERDVRAGVKPVSTSSGGQTMPQNTASPDQTSFLEHFAKAGLNRENQSRGFEAVPTALEPVVSGGFPTEGTMDLQNHNNCIGCQDKVNENKINKILSDLTVTEQADVIANVAQSLDYRDYYSVKEGAKSSSSLEKIGPIVGSTISITEDAAKKTGKYVNKFAKFLKKFVSDNIFFQIKTEAQKKAEAEQKEKDAKNAANIKISIDNFSRSKTAYQIAEQKIITQDQQNKGIVGSQEEKNKLLGKSRNLNNQDVESTYHNQQVFEAQVEQEEEVEKQNQAQSLQAVARTGPNYKEIKFAGERQGSQHILNTAG